MQYDVVIATRNRLDALRMSIPLILEQTCLPGRIIIVDASDDHEAVRTGVAHLLSQSSVLYTILQSPQRNSSFQRNLGLALVEAPIVIFPDDDSLWFGQFAAEILGVYERDTADLIGGVSGTETTKSPVAPANEIYAQDRRALSKLSLLPLRNRIERIMVPRPFELFARDLWPTRSIQDWIGKADAPLVETLGGFRMSFRTHVIRQTGFDEVLGHGIGYGLHEDMEASLSVQARGYVLVGANKASVFHHTFPGRRASGFNYGFCHLANYIYVCRKLFPKHSRAWGALERYLLYKLTLYGLRIGNAYNREVFAGALSAWQQRRRLTDAPADKLEDAYRGLCNDKLQRQSSPPYVSLSSSAGSA